MWKYKSSDFEHISLHDHCIDRIISDGNDILLIFDDGFDIVKTHPLNITGKSKQTTNAQIVLRNAGFLKGVEHRWNQKKKCSEEKKFDFAYLIGSAFEAEILKFKLEDGVFSLDVKLCLHEPDYYGEFAELSFTCTDSLFCWNDYSSDSWFEG